MTDKKQLDFWADNTSAAIKRLTEALKSGRKHRTFLIAETPFGVHIWEKRVI